MVEVGSFVDNSEDLRTVIKSLHGEIEDLKSQIIKKDNAIRELKERIDLLNGVYNTNELLIVTKRD